MKDILNAKTAAAVMSAAPNSSSICHGTPDRTVDATRHWRSARCGFGLRSRWARTPSSRTWRKTQRGAIYCRARHLRRSPSEGPLTSIPKQGAHAETDQTLRLLA
eukprot:5914172-Prymnesium_polylepis.1